MRRAAKRDAVAPRHKYRAIPTVVDGIRFASKKEAQRYVEHRLAERVGLIRRLRLQPAFDLDVPRVGGVPGEVVTIGRYVADFAYDEVQIDEGGFSGRLVPVVEDVKGFKTPVYRLKKKHVEAQYGIEIREV